MTEQLKPWHEQYSLIVSWLESVRDSASALAWMVGERQALVSVRDMVLPWSPGSGEHVGSMGGSISDPTYRLAYSRIEGLDTRISTLTASIDHHEQVVGDCLRILHQMESELSASHAVVIERYYIDMAGTWTEVADELSLSYRRVCQLRKEACSWLYDNRAYLYISY